MVIKVKKITINAHNGSPCGGLRETNWVGIDFLDGTSEYYETENQIVNESDGESKKLKNIIKSMEKDGIVTKIEKGE